MVLITKDYGRRVQSIGAALLLVLYFLVPTLIRLWGGSTGFDVVFLFTFWSIGALFCFGACLLWWRIVTVHAKWIAPNKAAWSSLALLPVILIGGYAAYCSWPSVRAERVLYNADLAPLPPSACEIKVNLWFTPFSGDGQLRFRATPDDIARFLATSPILRDVQYVRYAGSEVALFYPRDERNPMSLEETRERIARDLTRTPVWFVKELEGSMTWYRIDPSGSQTSGTLIVDDDRHVVYVRLTFD